MLSMLFHAWIFTSTFGPYHVPSHNIDPVSIQITTRYCDLWLVCYNTFGFGCISRLSD